MFVQTNWSNFSQVKGCIKSMSKVNPRMKSMAIEGEDITYSWNTIATNKSLVHSIQLDFSMKWFLSYPIFIWLCNMIKDLFHVIHWIRTKISLNKSMATKILCNFCHKNPMVAICLSQISKEDILESSANSMIKWCFGDRSLWLPVSHFGAWVHRELVVEEFAFVFGAL